MFMGGLLAQLGAWAGPARPRAHYRVVAAAQAAAGAASDGLTGPRGKRGRHASEIERIAAASPRWRGSPLAVNTRGRCGVVAAMGDCRSAFDAERAGVDSAPEDRLPGHAREVELASDCLRGDRESLQRLETLLARTVPLALARWRNARTTADELHQVLRVKLLVGTESSLPKLGEYAGRGALRHWLRLVAVRTLIDLERGRDRAIPLEANDLGVLPSDTEDPLLATARRRYREQFKAAFVEAVSSLTPRERNVLRQHYLGQLTLEQLASLYRVHRVTVARWLAQARQTLLRRTRALLGAHLRPSEVSVESVVHLLRSELAASMQRIFGSEGP
jgi:RNA polymerase sigma-70 factor (ECF subfamily)